jgi:hypothetical protein
MHLNYYVQVVTLVMRVEQIRDGEAVPAVIHLAMAQWYNGVSKLQNCRQSEIFNAANRQYSRSPQYQKERGNFVICHLLPLVKVESGLVLE